MAKSAKVGIQPWPSATNLKSEDSPGIINTPSDLMSRLAQGRALFENVAPSPELRQSSMEEEDDDEEELAETGEASEDSKSSRISR